MGQNKKEGLLSQGTLCSGAQERVDMGKNGLY